MTATHGPTWAAALAQGWALGWSVRDGVARATADVITCVATVDGMNHHLTVMHSGMRLFTTCGTAPTSAARAARDRLRRLGDDIGLAAYPETP